MNIKAVVKSVLVCIFVGACASTSQTTPVVDLWHIQGIGEGRAIVEDAVMRFNDDNSNVKVNARLHLNDPYKLNIREVLRSGTAPCIFPTWGGGVLQEYINQDLILELTEMIKVDGYDDRYVSRAFDNVTFDRKYWGVPVENTTAAVVFFNKDIFNTFGLTPPDTYDQLLFIINTLSNAGISPFALANKTMWPGSMHYAVLVDSLGGSETFKNAALRQGASFNDPVFIEAARLLQDLVRQNAFNTEFNNLVHDSGGSRSLLYAETAAMEIMGSWNIPLIKSEKPQFYESKLDFFMFPSITSDPGSPRSVVGTIGDQYYHVSRTCQYPDIAFAMIQYLVDDVAIQKRLQDFGSIPPIKGLNPSEPISRRVLENIESASDVYLWYDQALPFELGEVHKTIVQQLLNLSISPEDAALTMVQASEDYYSE